MGYKIYWKTKENFTREEVIKCVEMIKEVIEDNHELIDYEGKIDRFNIGFNGIGENSHETFVFYSDFVEESKEGIIQTFENEERNDITGEVMISGFLRFNFCKTQRKPYDKIVKKVLMKIQEITNNKLEVTCDDGYEYFKDIIKEGKKKYKLDDLKENYSWVD